MVKVIALMMAMLVELTSLSQTNPVSAPSHLIFFELIVRDLAKAKSFYAQLFGWDFAQSPSADFVTIKGAGVSGGMLRDPNKKNGDGNVKVFFDVDDVALRLQQAKRLGAEVLIEEMRVSPARTLAEFRDPDGNGIGIMHAAGAK